MRQYAMTFITIALLTAATPAETATDAARGKAIAETIAPMLDNQTFAVIRIDIAKIQFAQIAEWFKHLTGFEASNDIFWTTRVGQFEVWKDRLLASGAKEVYLPVSPADFPRFLPTLVVPVPAGADAEAILKAIRTRIDGKPGVEHGTYAHGVSGIEGRFVVAAVHESRYRQVASAKSLARPELAAAFAEIAGKAIQLVLIPSDEHRRIIAETLPQLPTPFPPDAATVLTRGVRWASVGVTQPPDPSAALVIQSADAEAANAFAELFNSAIALMVARAHAEGVPDPEKLAAFITPTVRGDQLVVEWNQATISRMMELATSPAMKRAQKETHLQVAQGHMRAIVTGVLNYAHDHKHQTPPHLEELLAAGTETSIYILPRALASPLTGRRSYVYIRPPKLSEVARPERFIVVYEDAKNHDMDRTVAGFLDGHAELAKPELFDARLAESRKLSAEAYGDGGGKAK